MTSSEAISYLEQMRVRYLVIRFIETTFVAVSVGLLSFSVLSLSRVDFITSLIISLSVALIFFVLRSITLGLFGFSKSIMASYLSLRYRELEESTDLILIDDQKLSLIQLIQKKRTVEQLGLLGNTVKLPNKLGLAIIAILGGLLIFIITRQFDLSVIHSNDQVSSTAQKPVQETTPIMPLVIRRSSVAIQSPDYTGIKSTIREDLNITVPEGSIARWSVEFSKEPHSAQIIFSGKDTLSMAQAKGIFGFSKRLVERGFYQIRWENDVHEFKSTDFFKIEIIKDQAPKIVIEDLEQFTELSYSDQLTLSFNSTFSDDYGLKDAHIIATVSKGSGESVKFREEKLRFDSPAAITGKQVGARKTIHFKKLGMEPGDELYFYIEAFDNKVPDRNKSRTETWFIALKDTTTEVVTEDSGMGVDLMPEYFRSQRQIIIDTEKLIDEQAKKKVAKADFNFRSNELGYDQKVLRLRYGQFLGEEFESSIVHNEAEEEGGAETEEEVKEKYGHVHDKENEHNLVKEKSIVKEEEHDHEKSGDPDTKEDPLAAFAHQHDKGDEATFFIQSIKVKLKAALTLMWDAELQLRLYEPAKSLPYQYKILKLLKEISNDSRVYVHRNGFDAPPLKEEKRLTADMADVRSSSNQYNISPQKMYPAINKSVDIISEALEKDSITLSEDQRKTLRASGSELAQIAIEQPGAYLRSLSLLKSIADNEIEETQLKAGLIEIRMALWKVLPQKNSSPSGKSRSVHSVDKAFIKHLSRE